MRKIRMLRAFFLRFWGLPRATRQNQAFAEELEAHLQMHIDDNIRSGMRPEQARREALLKLGGIEATTQAYRDQNALPFFEALIQDLRYTLRQLHKHAGFTCAAIVVLALGTCASLAIFAFVDASLIKPLPYRNPARLVDVAETKIGTFTRSNLSYPDYLDWKRRNRVFRSLDVYQGNPFLLTTPAGAQPSRGARVSAGFFRTLGVVPVLGRDFNPDDDSPSAARVALLSYAAWQQRYGGRRDALGQVVTLDGFPHVIIGVLPREFYFSPVGRPDFWTAMQATSWCLLNRQCHSIYGVARLDDGVSRQAALSNLKGIAADLEKQYPESNRDRGAAVAPLGEIITGDIRPALMVLLGGAELLLLISAVNVAGLVLLRSQDRQREIALRRALGASSGRLIAQFANEALALAVGGGAIGVALAGGAIQLLQKLLPDEFRTRLPFLDGLGVNDHILVAGAALTALMALLLSLPPCIGIRRSDLRSGLAEANRGTAGTVWRRFGSHLVVVELTTAMVLLVGAGLLSKSLYRLMRVELGIEPDRLVTLEVVAPQTVYSPTPKIIALARQIESDVENLPGVVSVGIAVNGVPVTANDNTTWFYVPNRPWHGEHYDAPQRFVSPGYFTALGARLLRGRYFNDTDDASKPTVAIVNRALARTYFPDEDAVGKQIVEPRTPPVRIQIVGIVDDIREGPLDIPVPPVLYFPFAQRNDTGFALVVRAAGGEQGLLPAMAAAIRKIDPAIVTRDGMTMPDRIHDSPSAYMHRSLAWLVGGFAAVALFLSVVGLYGVVAYSVGQRTREIGVRMALGAQRSTIYQLVMKEAACLIGIGLGAGLVGSFAAATLIRSLLFGTKAWDVTTLVIVGVILATSALGASYVPARRAASVNPIDALRAE